MTQDRQCGGRRKAARIPLAFILTGLTVAGGASAQDTDKPRWLAGDHHVHSRFSATYTPNPADPDAVPTPTLGGDGPHTIVQNGAAAGRFGLSWMVSTDHGGPRHSAINAEQAYPELLQSRVTTPGVIQFYGMELDTPGSEHSSLIIPVHDGEREMLRRIEARWGSREPWPADASHDTRTAMLELLRTIDGYSPRPIVIANHPSRSAEGFGVWGEHDAGSLRDWQDAAPRVAIGMEGAPGHQATSLKPTGERGIYRRYPTMGGFDQMTATLGGLWDAMLGEGRHWWITATSDSHRHWSEGGDDFWPGEYSKTWVMARPQPDAILDGLRSGQIFVATGDLVTAMDVTVAGGEGEARMGQDLTIAKGSDVVVTIRLRDPAGANSAGRTPEVKRIDLVVGDVTGPNPDRMADHNTTSRVERRFTAADWTRDGEVLTVRHVLRSIDRPLYLRVRATGGMELEPVADLPGEDPWSDLWAYGNPVFVKLR
jgi:hypothetical protein